MNLKGNVIVELKDVYTGETKRYEHSNLVTNAVKDLLTPALLSYNYSRSEGEGGFSCAENFLCPLGERGYGGILLWDAPIDEDADNYAYPPRNAHIVGYSDRNSTTDAGMRGSMNNGETHWNDDGGITTVWDWGTSQGNGKIQAITLVNRTLGGDPNRINFMSSSYYLTTKTDQDHRLIYYDENSGYGYSYVPDGNTNAYIFYRDRYMVGKLNLRNRTYRQTFDSTEQIGQYPYPKTQHGNARTTLSYDNGYVYLCKVTGDWQKGYRNVLLHRCKLTDLNDVTKWEILINEEDYSASLTSDENGYDSGKVINQYLCLPTNTGDSRWWGRYVNLYKINVNNKADITRIELPADDSEYIGNGANGCITAGKSLIYADNTVTTFQNSEKEYRQFGHYCISDNSLHVTGGYLGTIFNIPEVNKTATQTMKVTYTLTPSEESE